MMSTNIEDYIKRTNGMEWQPLREDGVDTQGIFVKVLRFDSAQNRPPSILLKFEAGAKYPFHNHPAGEELMVLSGSCFVNDTKLSAGDYLYTPPDFKHSVRSETGCELMLIIPEEVQILSS